MDRRAAIAQLVGAAALAASAPSRAQAAAVALQARHTGDIGALTLVEATVQGRRLRMMIDTGASSAVISPAIARELALPVRDRVRVATLGGTQSADRVRLGALRLGDTVLAESDALVLDLHALMGPALDGVDGLIGMPSLRQTAHLFDFPAGRLQSGAEALHVLRDRPRGPLRFDGGLPVIELRLNGREPAPFLLDTGNAGALVVFEHHARRLLDGAGTLPETAVRELGGDVRARFALVDRVEGAGFTARSVPTAFESGARARRGGHFDRLAGSLGIALFRGVRVGLDAGRTPAWLVDAPAGAELPVLPGGFGLALGGRQPPRVVAVVDGGPAARAGLLPGSRLLGVAGQSVAGSAPHEVWAQLDGIDRAEFAWSTPADEAQRATLQRERFFPVLR